jgi:hypothetical protein
VGLAFLRPFVDSYVLLPMMVFFYFLDFTAGFGGVIVVSQRSSEARTVVLSHVKDKAKRNEHFIGSIMFR